MRCFGIDVRQDQRQVDLSGLGVVQIERAHVVGQQRQVHRLAVQLEGGFGVQPAQRHQLLQQPGCALGGRLQFFDRGSCAGQIGRNGGPRQAQLQAGERRANLVRRIGGESPLAQQQLVDAAQQVVQGAGKGQQFARHALQVYGLQRAVRTLVPAPGYRLQRAQGPAQGQHNRQRGGHQQCGQRQQHPLQIRPHGVALEQGLSHQHAGLLRAAAHVDGGHPHRPPGHVGVEDFAVFVT